MRNLSQVLRFAWTYLRRYWPRLVMGLLLGVVFGLFNASFVWATRTLTQRLSPQRTEQVQKTTPIAKPRKLTSLSSDLKQFETKLDRRLDLWLPRHGRELDWRQMLGGLLFLPILVSFRGVAGYLSGYCMGWVSERVINDLRYDLLAKLSTLSLDFFNRARTGDLLTRINSDAANLQRAMRVGFADLVKESITIATVFIYLCLLDWKLTLFSMIFLPFCLAPLFVLGKKARRASAKSVTASVTQATQLVDLFGGIRIVKAFGLEGEQLNRFRKLSKELVRQGVKGVRAKEMVNPVIEVVSTGAVGVLIVYLFAMRRTIEDLVGFLTGLLIFYTPVKRLASIHIMMEQAAVSVTRMMEVFEEQPSVAEPVRPKSLKQFTSEIHLECVSFAYAAKPVLRDVELRIPRGFRLGVAGPSGSGKSTLVNLLFRFYDPTRGAVRLDGIDLRELPTPDFRRLMALVSQEVVLFDQTVWENIACGKPGATRSDVEAAARGAFAHEFILQLPHGYDSLIGERGVTLSGGQRQRLAIARAFIRDAPILVLDEATAALDAEAEGIVQAAIERLSEHRTVVAVAHRLATLAGMDQIIFLAEGRITERGTFAELLDAEGSFCEMARRQGILTAPSRKLQPR